MSTPSASGDPSYAGHPNPGVRGRVLDESLALVAPGVLCIVGVGVARGHLVATGNLRRRFVAVGPRVYHCGGRVRWHPHGQLDLAGRAGDQVTIRGLRIGPGRAGDQVTIRGLHIGPGRAGDQVTIRGLRIGSREVEAV